MNPRQIVRAALVAIIKLVSLAAAVFLILQGIVAVSSALSPRAEDLCNAAMPGMTAQQVEVATPLREGWHLLRYDGTLAISSHKFYSNTPVCKVSFDANGRVAKKSVGKLETGDTPSL